MSEHDWDGAKLFASLVGKTIHAIEVPDHKETVQFSTDAGTFRMFHSQDCCESVALEEVVGDLSDLIGTPILFAEVVTNNTDDPPEYAESFLWTFYKLATVKGHVTLRWLGESNGYYSESVTFAQVRP